MALVAIEKLFIPIFQTTERRQMSIRPLSTFQIPRTRAKFRRGFSSSNLQESDNTTSMAHRYNSFLQMMIRINPSRTVK